jgi:hypothetical protein
MGHDKRMNAEPGCPADLRERRAWTSSRSVWTWRSWGLRAAGELSPDMSALSRRCSSKSSNPPPLCVWPVQTPLIAIRQSIMHFLHHLHDSRAPLRPNVWHEGSGLQVNEATSHRSHHRAGRGAVAEGRSRLPGARARGMRAPSAGWPERALPGPAMTHRLPGLPASHTPPAASPAACIQIIWSLVD